MKKILFLILLLGLLFITSCDTTPTESYITNIEENNKNITIYAEMERKEHICISCGTATNTIHDYREQEIKDIPAFGKIVSIKL